MARAVVIDACVLYTFGPRDLLLRLAEAGAFRPVWNAEILDEMARNLERNGVAGGSRLTQLLESAFEDAMDRGWPRFVHAVPPTVSGKDRHVVASALAQRAREIVTFNLSDFPNDALSGAGLTASHPDEFLLRQLEASPAQVLHALREQAAQLSRPALSFEALSVHVPRFTAAARLLLDPPR